MVIICGIIGGNRICNVSGINFSAVCMKQQVQVPIRHITNESGLLTSKFIVLMSWF